jgi:hypothetical protein
MFSYLMVVILVQFWINIGSVNIACNGDVANNMKTAAYWTFIPWLFIFGVMLIALVAFPGFKSAFSNVFGYFSISGRANRLLAELLVNREMEEKTDDAGLSNEEKKKFLGLQEAVMKLFGNMSILINKITPDNFNDFWNLLVPLMKQDYKNANLAYKTDFKDQLEAMQPVDGEDDKAREMREKGLKSLMDGMKPTEGQPEGPIQKLYAKKQELLNLVYQRDNIGEGFWYGYTALLVMTMVQYYISTADCNSDPEAMQKEYNKFQNSEQARIAADKSASGGKIVYTP